MYFKLEIMSYKEKCKLCNGHGGYDALISQHDDKTEYTKCPKCNGGFINRMSDEDEADYHADFW